MSYLRDHHTEFFTLLFTIECDKFFTQDINLCPIRGTTTLGFHYSLWQNATSSLHRTSIYVLSEGPPHCVFILLFMIKCDKFFTQDINLCPIRGTTTLRFHPTLYDRMRQVLYTGHQFMSYPRDPPHWVFTLLFMTECDKFFTQDINLCPSLRDHHTEFSPYSLW